jgi:hypothetical protein
MGMSYRTMFCSHHLPFHTIRHNTALHSDTCVKLLDTVYFKQYVTHGDVLH